MGKNIQATFIIKLPGFSLVFHRLYGLLKPTSSSKTRIFRQVMTNSSLRFNICTLHILHPAVVISDRSTCIFALKCSAVKSLMNELFIIRY